MTQDEILKATLEEYIDQPLGSVPMPALYAALEQQAVTFAEWISNHRLDFQTASAGRWIGLDMEILTSAQLYQLFKQQNP